MLVKNCVGMFFYRGIESFTMRGYPYVDNVLVENYHGVTYHHWVRNYDCIDSGRYFWS
jgi:hypothetical protein